MFSALGFVLADARNTLDPAAAQALNVLSNDFFFPLAVGMSVFMIGNGLAIVRTGAMPKWLGWVALPIGIAALTPAGFFGPCCKSVAANPHARSSGPTEGESPFRIG